MAKQTCDDHTEGSSPLQSRTKEPNDEGSEGNSQLWRFAVYIRNFDITDLCRFHENENLNHFFDRATSFLLFLEKKFTLNLEPV